MSDDLPVDLDDIDEDVASDEQSDWGLGTWLLAAGGVVAAIFILSWVFSFLAWLASYALYAGVGILALYVVYKGVEYMVGGESASDRQTAMPESNVSGELDDLSAGSDLDSELEGLDDLETTSEEEVTLGDLSEEDLEADIESDIDSSSDLEDGELEQKFAELEKEMSEE